MIILFELVISVLTCRFYQSIDVDVLS